MIKKILVSLVVVFAILFIGVEWWIHVFDKKTYVPVEEVCVPSQSDFYPLGYVFVHNKKKAKNLLSIFEDNQPIMFEKLKDFDFDFNRYSYLITYGAPVKKIYYSMKTTWWDDPDPPYAKCRKKGLKFVAVEYKEVDKKAHLYKLDRDTTLSGNIAD